MIERRFTPHWVHWFVALILVLIVAVSGVGFALKLWEFVVVFSQSAEGAFAITPVVNYGLATAGFLCLLLWGMFNGMFRDIEEPKYTMLEREARIDEWEMQHRAKGGR